MTARALAVITALTLSCSRGAAPEAAAGEGSATAGIPPPASFARVGAAPVDDGGTAPECPDGAVCGNMFDSDPLGPWSWLHRHDAGRGSGRPRLREGAVTVTGDLPPEVVRRIVRQNFGRFRVCYQNGLRTNPALAGGVTAKFIVDYTGAVASVTDGGSSLPDAGVRDCVLRAVGGLSFPSPSDGGRVIVVYPIEFSVSP